MAKEKVDTSGGGGSSEWLNTYADMVTLLLTFFILLFSMSSLDAVKFNDFVKAIKGDKAINDQIIIFGNPTDGPGEVQAAGELGEGATPELPSMAEIAQIIIDAIESQGMSDSIEVTHGEGYIFIRFMNDMLFEPNSPRLKSSDLEILHFIGTTIKSIEDEAQYITIHGHTAAIPEDPNYAVSDRVLSTDRANAVLTYFEDKVGITPEKLLAVGWGKNMPVASNDTEEGKSKNRRVEIMINSDNPIANQLDLVYEKLR